MKDLLNKLNKAFENKIRLGIMSALMVNERLSFTRLKELIGVTDGNLASHLKTLEKHEYIRIEKSFINRKPNTDYYMTEAGTRAFKAHIKAIEELLK